MRAHWFRTSSSVVAVLVGIATANAQGTGARTTDNSAPSATESEVGGVRAEAVVSPQEQVAHADAIVRRAGQLAERLSKMLDEARREKDIMRANCVNRKLTEVNANTRNVEQRARALRDAAQANDEARRSHEYTVLTVLSQKLSSLDQEATQCLGQSVYEPGASQVVTTIQQNAVVVDTSPATPPPSPPSVTVPPPLSATM